MNSFLKKSEPYYLKKFTPLFFILSMGSLLLSPINAWAKARFGERLCDRIDYACIEIKKNNRWESLFPDPNKQDLVKRVNRINIELKSGMKIAVPKNIDKITSYDISPFPRYIEPEQEKIIFVNQEQLAWAAYNEEGELMWWGPISPGSGTCKKIEGQCLSPVGSFRIIRKQDVHCISTVFPIRTSGLSGGAKMPYCMHFFNGYALHGADVLPGYADSHGCVRLFTEDAQWLNESFIDLPGIGKKGTRIVISDR